MEGAQRGPREVPSVTRARVAWLRQNGLPYVQIARRLGLAKSTVAYHARRLGEPADDRFALRYDSAEAQRAVAAGLSLRGCMNRFGFSRDAWGKAVKRGELVPTRLDHA